MKRTNLPIAVLVALVLILSAEAGTVRSPETKAKPADRVSVTFDAREAETALAILELRAAGRPVDEASWERLFTCEPYVRLKKREEEIGRRFKDPSRAFTDQDFRKFMLSPELADKAAGLRRLLGEWSRTDLRAAAVRILGYLPEGAEIRVKVYPMIKPRMNSFVFELDSDPTIFLYLNAKIDRPMFENTVAHEMHHIGLAFVEQKQKGQYDGLTPAARRAAECLGAFGEGFAMLAAAGGPDVHPHASSRPEDRARWDRDMAGSDADLRKVERFLMDVAEGRLKDPDEIEAAAGKFFGIQGPWYTVGYRMAVMVEKRFGRARLIECMKDPRLLLRDYNLAAVEASGAEGVGKQPALWSPEIMKALGLTTP